MVQALADLDTDPDNFDSTLTGVATAANITAIETANGTGSITGTGLTDIDGTAAAVVQALADLDTDPTNFDSTLSNTTLAAADVATINDDNGTGTIDISAATTINGSAADVLKIVNNTDSVFTTATNYAVTLLGTTVAADFDNVLNDTTGDVSVDLIELINATISNLTSGDNFGTGIDFANLESSINDLGIGNEDGLIEWSFDNGTNQLTIETADDGVDASAIVLTLTGVTSVTENGGVFIFTIG